MKRAILAGLLALAAALPAAAQEAITYETDASFEDAAFALENAIVNRGLVIDLVSHVGDMLERTREDVGGEETLFEGADIYVFCSATVSREVMEADPMNLAHCPYGVFVAERQGEVMVGYRSYPEGPMQKVQSLLDEIAREAAGM